MVPPEKSVKLVNFVLLLAFSQCSDMSIVTK